MKLKFCKIESCLIVMLIGTLDYPKLVSPVSFEARRVAEANSKFALAVYEILRGESRFEIFSPLALTTALLALDGGARGNTERIIKSGLHLQDIDRNILDTGISHILTVVREEAYRNVRFRSQLRILVPKSIVILQEYTALLKNRFNNGTISTFNYNNSFESEGQIVNWNSVKGNGQKPDSVGILLSAVDFIGPWKKKFGYISTRLRSFFINENNGVNVQMMNHDDYFHYANLTEMDASAVMLPLEGDRFGLIIVLPKSRTGLSLLETSLKYHPLNRIPRQLTRTWIELWIPRFQLDSTLPFVRNDILARLGMGAISYPMADFGGISCGGDLYFTDMTQRTLLEVNEEGLGGLKPSVPRIGKVISKINRTIFNAEHPFLFFIYDYLTKSILVIGRKVN